MAEERERILERLAALQRQASGAATPAAPPRPRAGAELQQGEDGSLERFLAALTAAGVTWELAESVVSARLALVSRLQDQGVTRLLSWAAESLPVPGLLEALEVLGMQVIVPGLRRPGQGGVAGRGGGRRQALLDIEEVALGITGADAAIADAGLFVLASGPGRPRVVAQLPRQHVVLLPLDRLYPTMDAWLAGLRAAGGAEVPGPWASLTLVAGPSKVSDIELETALGVHGPRFMHAILLQEPPG